ncbi:DUF397 domain-containing protein [Actinomadura sp. 1N219]|uniref:DUF397 domain-containing protein n=1 Tax=Actinomadura sp. 1N219 TaxID=3375152 RepID=UPI0037905017
MSAGFTAATWRKSSRSNSDQACVEVARGVVWRKSSRSNSDQDCVEVAQVSAAVGIRDSKDPESGHLTLDRAAFGALLAEAKTGALDL